MESLLTVTKYCHSILYAVYVSSFVEHFTASRCFVFAGSTDSSLLPLPYVWTTPQRRLVPPECDTTTTVSVCSACNQYGRENVCLDHTRLYVPIQQVSVRSRLLEALCCLATLEHLAAVASESKMVLASFASKEWSPSCQVCLSLGSRALRQSSPPK